MIAVATLLGVAQSRGQNLLGWFFTYMAVMALAAFLGFATKSIIVVVVFESLFTLTFLLSYHLYSDETKAELLKNADPVAVVNAKQEQFKASLVNWEVVKVYTDSFQERELLQDRAMLGHHQVRSFVKTAGITTLMVHRDQFERANELLGIIPLENTDMEQQAKELGERG